MSYQDSRAGLQLATDSPSLNSALENDKSLKPAPVLSQSFARISADISELTLNLTPCARRFYDWLLQQKRSGIPQEVQLETFAETTANRRQGAYCLPHIKRALSQLLDSGLVQQVFRYSSKIFKLVAHDSRTFSSRSEMEMSQDLIKKSKTEASNPYAAVPLYREDQRKTTDQNQQPVEIDREDGLIEASSTELETANSLELLKEVEATLQQPLSTNLQQLVLSFTICRVRDSLDSYREAKQQSSSIRDTEAWFAAALQRAYKPKRATSTTPHQSSAAQPAQQALPPGFEEWFAIAKPAGVASASSYVNGEFSIHTSTGWETWVEMQQVWPLERLRSIVSPFVAPPSVKAPSAAIPQPTAEELADPVKRGEILARLKGRFAMTHLRDEAVRWAKEWGFAVSSAGIAEGGACG